MKVYGTYNQRFIEDGTFTENSSLNGYYDLSFFLDYPSYQLPTLIVKDGILTNTDKKIFVAEYDENVINQETIDYYIANIPSEFNVEILSNPIEWVKNNTNYQETEPGKFLIIPETEMMGIVSPAKYLIIE